LQQEVGGAVILPLASAHDAEGGDAVGGFEGVAQFSRIQPRHGEEPVRAERVAEHLTVSRLKDVQRQQGLREKGQVGQGHYRHFVGNRDFDIHACTVGGSALLATAVHVCAKVSRKAGRDSLKCATSAHV
jgi:hypothetical protein